MMKRREKKENCAKVIGKNVRYIGKNCHIEFDYVALSVINWYDASE